MLRKWVFPDMANHCCEVFADVNAIYFSVLRWIMNDWDCFETVKNQLLGKRIWILFLLWKWIKYTFILFVLTICIKKMPGVGSIAMKSIRTANCSWWNQKLLPFFLSNKWKMYGGPCTSPLYPPKFIYIDIFWT